MSLAPALAAEHSTQALSGGLRMHYYHDGPASGRPLLVLHSINAAPSSMEMKPLFEAFRAERPCYSPDLPGFGLSPRPDIRYTTSLYSGAIASLLSMLDAQHGLAADVVALSLTGEFTVRAAVDEGAPCRSISVLSPTGLGRREPPGPRFGDRVNAVTGTPMLGKALYRLLTSGPSVRWFLNQAFAGRAPAELVDYALATARMTGARYAPFAFLSMALFSRAALEGLYARMQQPLLLLYDEDPNVSFERLPELLARNTAVTAQRIAGTHGMPHWERPEATLQALRAFWSELDSH